MEGRPFALLGFLLLVAFPAGEANTFQSMWRHLEENYPYVLPEHSVEEEEPSVKPPNFSPLELAKMRRFLQKGPALKPDSVLGRILEGEQVPDVEAMEELDPAVISKKIENDPEYLDMLKEGYYDYLLQQFYNRGSRGKACSCVPVFSV